MCMICSMMSVMVKKKRDDKPHAACQYWRHIVHIHIEGNAASHRLVRKRVCDNRCIRAV